MRPGPPADSARDHEERLQGHVCIKPRAEEHGAKEQATQDAGPPGVHTVTTRQQNGHGVQGIGGNFPAAIHGCSSARSEVYCTTLLSSKEATCSTSSHCPGPNSSKSAFRIGSSSC